MARDPPTAYNVGWVQKVSDDIADKCVFLKGGKADNYYCGIYERARTIGRVSRRSVATTSTRHSTPRPDEDRSGIQTEPTPGEAPALRARA